MSYIDFECPFCDTPCGNDYCAYGSESNYNSFKEDKPLNLTRGRYGCDTSDLTAIVFKVHYESDKYYKAKIALLDYNGTMVEEAKNYKLYKSKIRHWKKL